MDSRTSIGHCGGSFAENPVRRALVVGLGSSGRSALDFLQRRGVEAIGFDDRLKSPTPSLEGIDALIVSPGVPPSHPLVLAASLQKIEIIGEAELGARALKNPAVGITGTNGKTTTTLLTAAILQEAGFLARPLGNIGIPLTTGVDQLAPGEIAVIELSSFQLETMAHPCLAASVILNITDDHLDRHGTFEAYKAVKMGIKNITLGPTYLSQEELPEVELPPSVVGIDAENARAAYALASFLGASLEDFYRALATFKRPAHRIETIASIGGVTYINDSKGTTVISVVKAVEKLPGPIALIAGGKDKGGSYAPWRSAFKGKVVGLSLIGEAACRIEEELDGQFAIRHCTSLKEAVDSAEEMLKGFGSVLLSPGCASYDMFENYEERGKMFRALVEERLR
ncbi:MAG: hypothetical protein JSR80_01960 [Verrucomicrobia bacterium]|nr:hypothetical protein [Verrucomicrobiota bacterium]